MDKLTQQLGEALDALHDLQQFPKLYGQGTAHNIVYKAEIALKQFHMAQAAERKAEEYPDTCPKCHNDPDACNCDGYFDRK